MIRGTRERLGNVTIAAFVGLAILVVDDGLRRRVERLLDDALHTYMPTDQLTLAFLGVGAGLLLLMVATLRR